jgi:NTE family protein
MVTKSFLFLLSISFLILVGGCRTAERRQVYSPQGSSGQSNEALPTQPKLDSSIPQTLPQVVEQRSGQALPVGVYLSPGAIRAYAHIGVLRALQRSQVPIVAIGGMEWGSLVAASYALARGANEVEWEMMKLKKDNLPTSAFLKRELEPQNPQALFEFLKASFGDKDLQKGSLPFICPTTDGQSMSFISSGKAREQLLRCAVLPPLYGEYERAGKKWISGAIHPGDWAGELRRLGAQFIIYIDVISQGNTMTSQKYANDAYLKPLWTAVRGISKQQHLFANYTIEVPLDIDLTDFDRRREAISTGERVTQTKLPEILKAVGLQ